MKTLLTLHLHLPHLQLLMQVVCTMQWQFHFKVNISFPAFGDAFFFVLNLHASITPAIFEAHQIQHKSSGLETGLQILLELFALKSNSYMWIV